MNCTILANMTVKLYWWLFTFTR